MGISKKILILLLLALELFISGCLEQKNTFTPEQISQLGGICPSVDFSQFKCPSLNCPLIPDCKATCTMQCDQRFANFQAPHETIAYSYNPNEKSVTIYGVDEVVNLYGASMQPAWYEGNLLLFKKYSGNKADIKEGQILLYQGKTERLIHKVVGVYPDGVWVVPLNVETTGERISYDSIIGINVGGVYR